MSILSGASILITGGTGAFGQAFTRRALDDGAARVAVLSRDEVKHAAMAASLSDPRVRHFVGDIRDQRRVAMAAHGVDYIIHAAAMKRVEHCEGDPDEAIATNVIGSSNVAHAAIAAGVKRAVLLSTDKAAAPCTLYGMTKAVAERAWIAANGYAAGTGTRLAATRYGNVLGSTGSLLPIWRAQAATKGVITMTDPNATRFWMTMQQAVDLVAHALTAMTGGETYTQIVGSASLMDIANVVAPLAALDMVGLRVGEKMHETMIAEDEMGRAWRSGTEYVKIMPAAPTWPMTVTPRAPFWNTPQPNGRTDVRSDDWANRYTLQQLTEMIDGCR